MAEFAAEQETLHSLRAQLADYEQIFRKAAPRLAAFKRLEEVAREHNTTPESIAAGAALAMINGEVRAKESEHERLVTECNSLKGELSMLLQNKKQVGREVEDLRSEFGDLHDEATEILGELDLLRTESVRLMAERRQLDQELDALRAGVRALRDRRVDDVPAPAEEAPAAPTPGRTSSGFDLADDEDEGRRFDTFFHAEVEHDKARDWILG